MLEIRGKLLWEEKKSKLIEIGDIKFIEKRWTDQIRNEGPGRLISTAKELKSIVRISIELSFNNDNNNNNNDVIILRFLSPWSSQNMC